MVLICLTPFSIQSQNYLMRMRNANGPRGDLVFDLYNYSCIFAYVLTVMAYVVCIIDYANPVHPSAVVRPVVSQSRKLAIATALYRMIFNI
jgi:hypothetical protein